MQCYTNREVKGGYRWCPVVQRNTKHGYHCSLWRIQNVASWKGFSTSVTQWYPMHSTLQLSWVQNFSTSTKKGLCRYEIYSSAGLWWYEISWHGRTCCIYSEETYQTTYEDCATNNVSHSVSWWRGQAGRRASYLFGSNKSCAASNQKSTKSTQSQAAGIPGWPSLSEGSSSRVWTNNMDEGGCDKLEWEMNELSGPL